MKTLTAICATLLGATLVAGGPASADAGCAPRDAAAGLCAPLHLADGNFSRSELQRMRAYQRGYEDALNRRGAVTRNGAAPPPAIALDGKEGYSQSYEVHRRYLDRNGNYDPRYDRGDRDDYYDRRLRRNDREEAIDFATQLLRGLSN